jgi:hypothetical protein
MKLIALIITIAVLLLVWFGSSILIKLAQKNIKGKIIKDLDNLKNSNSDYENIKKHRSKRHWVCI